jgi:hypothetical protein
VVPIRALRSFTEHVDIVRLDDGEQIAVPRWMLDPVYCAQLPQETRPRIALPALLRLVSWLAARNLIRCPDRLHPEGSAQLQSAHALRTHPTILSATASAGPTDTVGPAPGADALKFPRFGGQGGRR